LIESLSEVTSFLATSARLSWSHTISFSVYVKLSISYHIISCRVVSQMQDCRATRWMIACDADVRLLSCDHCDE